VAPLLDKQRPCQEDGMRKQRGLVPNENEYLIAYHIRELREEKYPGRGGGQKCAEDMKINKSQYYLWESGSRTPRGRNLQMMADFFGKDVSYFHEKPENWREILAGILTGTEKDSDDADALDDAAESDGGMPRPPTTREAMVAMEKMNAVITHLLKKQVMLEEGKLNPREFTKAIEELRGYALFKLPE
jgi:transcriptional regulator with XRE-family HTH domain